MTTETLEKNTPNLDEPLPTPTPLTINGQSILFPPLPFDLKARADLATKDEKLQQFVNHAAYSRDQQRKNVCGETFGENYDPMRELAGDIKQHTLDHLDYYLEQFIKNATDAGVKMHYALDGKQANQIAVDIAKENDCKLCVKSKSMVTEETHLVPALEEIGCETVETDLGEFILQIDGDAPSHLVQPMIHKDRVATAEAFTRVLGAKYTEDADELTKIAREYLRNKYRKADLGISGGNFLVAETGTITIITNEGNARLSTSSPRIHVAFVGIEKLVPSLEHLAVFLKLLGRSATGQPLSVYTTFITGPKKHHEHGGPEEVHIVLIDNGRTEVLKEETREMLRCIRCGACLNACPVYRKIGGHSYGSVYSGPIGAILTPVFKGLANYKDLPNASSLCGACYEACPVKINIPKYLVQLRRDMVGGNMTGWLERFTYRFWTWTLKSSLTYRFTNWGQKLAFRLKAKMKGTLAKGDPYSARGWLDKVPLARGWTNERDMPSPPQKNFRHWWNKEHKK